MNFLGAISYLMKGMGIEDILNKAKISNPGTANKIMTGKEYYAMLKAQACRCWYRCTFMGIFWDLAKWGTWSKESMILLSKLRCKLNWVLKNCDTKQVQSACQETEKPLQEIRWQIANFMEAKWISPTSKLWLMYMAWCKFWRGLFMLKGQVNESSI